MEQKKVFITHICKKLHPEYIKTTMNQQERTHKASKNWVKIFEQNLYKRQRSKTDKDMKRHSTSQLLHVYHNGKEENKQQQNKNGKYMLITSYILIHFYSESELVQSPCKTFWQYLLKPPMLGRSSSSWVLIHSLSSRREVLG